MAISEKETKRIFRAAMKDLGFLPDRIKYYLKNYRYTYLADKLIKEAFLQDKNMDSIRELRSYIIEIEGDFREPLRRDKK